MTSKTNILVIGSGGREHAIVRALYKSETTNEIFCVPGNPGISQLARCVNIDIKNFDEIVNFCKSNRIDLVVIGPEQPLADGLADVLRGMDIPVFGPSQYAAQLESSKSFAKNFMKKYNIPTAQSATFSKDEFELAIKYINEMSLPVVIKADGLAAGKGVVIANDKEEAIATVKFFLEGALGVASQQIVIEEFMCGEEASVFAICDGNDFITLSPAQDHKRIGDGDTGKNTGGMGAYSPVSIIDETTLEKVCRQIIKPTIDGMKSENHLFIGCLYVGLMIENGNPRVVEFNVRFGDPETQAVLSLFSGDFTKLLYSAACGNLDKTTYNQNIDKASCCVILASEGYPDKYGAGYEINGDAYIDTDEIIVYHSGTKIANDKLITAGGRVLGVTAVDSNIEKAIDKVYKYLEQITFENRYYRNDIGQKELQRKL